MRIQKAGNQNQNGSPYSVPFESLVSIKEGGSSPSKVFQNGNIRVTITPSGNSEEVSKNMFVKDNNKSFSEGS